MSVNELKVQIRNQVKFAKRLLSQAQKLSESQKVFSELELMQEFVLAKRILCYWSLPDELQTQLFIDKWYSKKKIYLPRIDNNELKVIRYSGIEFMQTGSFGILEPKGDCIEDLRKIDLIIVPGVAFSNNGNRLGRGGGYYDRLLQKTPKAYKIGVGYSVQLKESVPVLPHDIKMDSILIQ